MKRILAVLLFVAVASIGFSVSGQVYTEIRDSGPSAGGSGIYFYTQEPWSTGAVTPLDDLRCGRQGTGVDLNFDTVTLTYKLRDTLSGVQGLDKLGAWGPSSTLPAATVFNGTSALATSPGYLQLSGIKAGPVDLAIGASWWGAFQGNNVFNTNGATTNWTAKNLSYNLFALDLVYGFSIGDVRIHADPWDRVEVCGYSGNYTTGAPNGFQSASAVSGYGFRAPITIDYAAGPFSLEIAGKLIGDGQSFWDNGAMVGYNDSQFGAVAKINYTLNELWGVWVDVGIVYISGGYANTNSFSVGSVDSSTNFTGYIANATNTYGGLVIPSTFGIKMTPAPVWTINLGYGYAFTVGYQVQTIQGHATNTSVYGSLPDTMYDAYGCHGYDHPFVNLSVDTKFATDWTAGLRFIVYIDNPNGQGGSSSPGNGTGANAPYINNIGGNGGATTINSTTGAVGNSLVGNGGQVNSTTTTGGSVTYTTINNWLYFNNEGDWDNFGGSACYLGYSKDNFSVKMYTAANTTQTGQAGAYNANGGAEGSVGLLGLFGEIDVSIKF
jgi:hypothetical protein